MELMNKSFDNLDNLVIYIVEKLEYLVSSRPTAVNMKEAAVRFCSLAKKLATEGLGVEEIKTL